jgi:exodeoxyribonuclease VII large subunit
VPVDVALAHASTRRAAAALRRHGRRAIVERARRLSQLGRVPGEHVARHRRDLHQRLRELRAASGRRAAEGRELTRTRAVVLQRKTAAATGGEAQARRRALDGLGLALAAHDPRRVLERGYAMVDDGAEGLVTSREQARAAGRVRITFADGSTPARIEDDA